MLQPNSPGSVQSGRSGDSDGPKISGADLQPHALIVEDDPLIAQLLEHHLRLLGYPSIDVAHTAIDAIASVCKRDPDVVLLDILLNDGSNGIEVAHRIQERSQTPFVFVTARPALANRESYAVVLDKRDVEPRSLLAAINRARGILDRGDAGGA